MAWGIAEGRGGGKNFIERKESIMALQILEGIKKKACHLKRIGQINADRIRQEVKRESNSVPPSAAKGVYGKKRRSKQSYRGSKTAGTTFLR